MAWRISVNETRKLRNRGRRKAGNSRFVTPDSDDNPATGNDDALRSRISELAAECVRLRRENDDLRRRLGTQAAAVESVPAIAESPMPANPARTFLPQTDDDIVAHLTGRKTIGVYPLMCDETCWFLAADFDKTGWQEDARAFLGVCRGA